MQMVEVGKSYFINYDGKVKLDAKIFKVYTDGNKHMVEWGITGAMVVETIEQFNKHLEAATPPARF